MAILLSPWDVLTNQSSTAEEPEELLDPADGEDRLFVNDDDVEALVRRFCEHDQTVFVHFRDVVGTALPIPRDVRRREQFRRVQGTGLRLELVPPKR